MDANYKNRNTILSYGLGREVGPIMAVGDARQNFTQKYRVVRVVDGKATVLRQGLLVPPPNVGKNVTPLYNDADGKAVSGATTLGDLDVVHAVDDLRSEVRRDRLGRAHATTASSRISRGSSTC